MSDTRRNQIIEIIEREFIGPDPILWEGSKQLVQDNGEEILTGDPPRTRYIAGILFPQAIKEENISEEDIPLDSEPQEFDHDDIGDEDSSKNNDNSRKISKIDFLEDAEDLINLSNAYKPSAMSLTLAIAPEDAIYAKIAAGMYEPIQIIDDASQAKSIVYYRRPIIWDISSALTLPTENVGIIREDIPDTNLRFSIVFRYKVGENTIYTFSLENRKFYEGSGFKDEDCYFQVRFELSSLCGFAPLPSYQSLDLFDEDYASNQLLYRKIKTYALGHGCSADWDESEPVHVIRTTIFPRHEIRPVVPSRLDGITLEMYDLSNLGNFHKGLSELKELCRQYDNWIKQLKIESLTLDDTYSDTSNRHIGNCETCLSRMLNGINLIENNEFAQQAFQFMNHAMLLQQLHSKLPFNKWIENEETLVLENDLTMPNIEDSTTWYNHQQIVYGKWRPFQLAFILINIESMVYKTSAERDIIDLIWFPTGGGKTEAYLGLSAFAIFMRRLKKSSDTSTAIMMRYTLRLLTAQQYQRAASLICACEYLRRKNAPLFGEGEINIGLWVGGETTPNTMDLAVKAYGKLYSGDSNENPFLVLQCPWCGSQMGPVQKSDHTWETPGYVREPIGRGKKLRITFRCANEKCYFSTRKTNLPLYIIDDDIYTRTPTLVLGTVDKFAMLPFRPQAQGLFGFKDGVKISTPDLIIQDELHLISGPLGSMVGHYETLIQNLCKETIDGKIVSPKIIASTATISRAKEQCHALYRCEKENVFQFPPQGIEASHSFFAEESKSLNGRTYVGILAPGATSESSAAIRLYSGLLYAAKTMNVESEEERDPYWTNIGYYNSIRELGQAATWIKSDIVHYLDVMYKRRYLDKQWGENYRNLRRYIWRSEELTSRIRSDKVTESLKNLDITYPPQKVQEGEWEEHPIDICLATNMISVGLDVQRLGLMTVAGQPKTTSEYIQATSRVGRDFTSAPGLVFVLYKPGRPRDKSHYEQFKAFHSKIYSYVEPTSVTPFSSPVRERALHAILIGLLRLQNGRDFNEYPEIPTTDELNAIKEIILERIRFVDPREEDATKAQLDTIIQNWADWKPKKFHDFYAGPDLPLMYPLGSKRHADWGESRSFPTPTSMRNVDAECFVKVLESQYYQ